MNFIRKILPHLNFISFVFLATLLIIDIFNPGMEFINNNITKGCLWGFCALCLLNGVVMLCFQTKKDKSEK